MTMNVKKSITNHESRIQEKSPTLPPPGGGGPEVSAPAFEISRSTPQPEGEMRP